MRYIFYQCGERWEQYRNKTLYKVMIYIADWLSYISLDRQSLCYLGLENGFENLGFLGF